MKTAEKVQKLEKEVAALWQVIEDEWLWHPSVVQEIRRRSRFARRAHARGVLWSAGTVR